MFCFDSNIESTKFCEFFLFYKSLLKSSILFLFIFFICFDLIEF
jgi:hypothetical protein